MASRVTGLEIGAHSVRAVVLETGFRGFELVEVAEEVIVEPEVEAPPPTDGEDGDAEATPLDEPMPLGLTEGTRAAIERLADRGLLESDSVVTALPRDAVYLTEIELPFANPNQIRPILAPQLDGRLPEETDELLFDLMVGGEAAAGGHVIHVAATRPERIAIFLGELQAVGIDPRVLDLAPMPVFTTSRLEQPEVTERVALVDIGAETTGLVVRYGEHVETVSVVGGGGEAITRALAATFDIDEATARAGKHREGFIDAGMPELAESSGDDRADTANACRRAMKPLVRRLRTTLHAHMTRIGAPVDRIELHGGTAALPGLAAYIEQSLGVPTTVYRAQHETLVALDGFEDVSHRFSAALGLALRAAPNTVGSRFDFRVGPFAFRGSYEHLQARLPELGIGTAAILAAALLLFFGRVAMLKAEQRQLDTALETVTTEMFGEAYTDPRSIQTQLMLAGAGPSLHPERSAHDHFVNLANVIGDMQDFGGEIRATTMEVDLGRYIFRLEGNAGSAEDVDELQTMLDEIDCLTDIERNDLSRDRDSGFRFSVQGAIDCSAPADVAAEGEAADGEEDAQ